MIYVLVFNWTDDGVCEHYHIARFPPGVTTEDIKKAVGKHFEILPVYDFKPEQTIIYINKGEAND